MAAKKSSRKYGPKASEAVEQEMHEFKRGKLKSGRSGRPVKSRKQAIAIGLSEARKEGARVPKKKTAAKKKSAKKSSRPGPATKRSATTKRTAAKSSSARKRTGAKRASARTRAAKKSSR